MILYDTSAYPAAPLDSLIVGGPAGISSTTPPLNRETSWSPMLSFSLVSLYMAPTTHLNGPSPADVSRNSWDVVVLCWVKSSRSTVSTCVSAGHTWVEFCMLERLI